MEDVPGFLGVCSGFSRECSWFSGGVPGFLGGVRVLGGVPGFLGVPGCSGVSVFLEVLHAVFSRTYNKTSHARVLKMPRVNIKRS